jgi:nucleoside-diphosphate-sugar epimerase
MKKNQTSGSVGKTGRRRILIVGCGDVGLRILPLLQRKLQGRTGPESQIFAVTSHAERAAALRRAGAVPIVANLDAPHSLARLAGLAQSVIYLAPPLSSGVIDQRSRNLAAVLTRSCRMVYISTSGVYGDCAGALVTETRPIQPHNDRARRRSDAEQVWRAWAIRNASSLAILRVPGIYAANRLPVERLHAGLPALLPDEDVYTSHIHADDLARLIVSAMWRGAANRIYHAVDDSWLLMGDYFDKVADHLRLKHPPRLPRAELAGQVTPMMLSFMSESRRLSNERIKNELGFRFCYPDVEAGLRQIPRD